MVRFARLAVAEIVIPIAAVFAMLFLAPLLSLLGFELTLEQLFGVSLGVTCVAWLVLLWRKWSRKYREAMKSPGTESAND